MCVGVFTYMYTSGAVCGGVSPYMSACVLVFVGVGLFMCECREASKERTGLHSVSCIPYSFLDLWLQHTGI